MEVNRVIVIVLDSVGVGGLPDADRYGDKGTNTLAHVAEAVGGLHLRFFENLGLGNIVEVPGLPAVLHPLASFGKMAEKSVGKDTTTGHWELMGLILKSSFPTYPQGFPPEIIEPFEKSIGLKVLGNKAASGTEIIKELGEEHVHTGQPIVYTSVDSVFQIAAHKKIIPLEELYRICQIARGLLTGKHRVARVIARPFVGDCPETFVRTDERKDFSIKPPQRTILDYAQEAGVKVYGVGKVKEIFGGRGFTACQHVKDNMDAVDKILQFVSQTSSGLILANLVDFDMLWGHRNNPLGYAEGLKAVDRRMPEIKAKLRLSDVLIFVADHGCDPTTPGTDHSREYVPLLVYGERVKSGVNLNVRETFADLGKTVADLLEFKASVAGTSFKELILR